MGNSFAKNYDCPKEHTATAGRDDLLWRIWPGKHKETKAEASIWVFDKSDVGKKKTYPLNPQAAGVSSTSYSSPTAPAPNIDKAILGETNFFPPLHDFCCNIFILIFIYVKIVFTNVKMNFISLSYFQSKCFT
jgi:hypothetical protein